MSAIIDLPFELSAAPSSFKPGQPSKLSAPLDQLLLPVGASFVAHKRRELKQIDFAEDDRQVHELLSQQASAAASSSNDVELEVGDEPESADLLERDPKEWKTQDHYAVLGLGHLRYRATQEHIKVAHRKKVLKHHPDKKAGQSGLANDDSFFKCIAKAHEVLSHPERRRQFDSVDEAIDDDDVPTGRERPEQFYPLWSRVFEREARFSEAKNGAVPQLGDASASRDEVNAFYDFWYNFDSWRSFEYLDKEINEGSDNRDDKRYTEKKNRNERARRKKEDNARLRSLVDKALSVDPRIKQFKADDKAAREAKRNKGKPLATIDPQAAEAERQAREAAELQAKKEAAAKEESDKAAKADAKKAKEAAKKNLKKAKKALRDLVTAHNYFHPAGTAVAAEAIERQLNELDEICAKLEPEAIGELKQRAEKAGGAEGVKAELKAAGEKAGASPSAFA